MMAQKTMDTSELVAAARDGDVVAFAELVRRHQSSVYAVAVSTVSDRGLAEDAVQEAFLIAWNDLGKLRDPDRIASWLCGIARNVARRLGRKSSREHAGEAEELADERSPLRDLLEREAEQSLGALLGRVPPRYREPMLLHYGAEHSVAEIAACLDLSEMAVKKRLSRGRELLRDRAERFAELAHACRVPAALAPAIIATISARSAAAQATGGAITSLTMTGVVMKKSLVVIGAVFLCIASVVAYHRWNAPDGRTEVPLVSVKVVSDELPPVTRELAKPARVSGVVKDRNTGEPIVGAMVMAARVESGILRDAASSAEIPPATQSDDSGRFSLELSSGDYHLSATARGYAGRRTERLHVGARELHDLELSLVSGGVRLHGVVTDVGGGPVAGAIVRLTESQSGAALPGARAMGAISQPDGSYELWLSPGSYELHAHHLDYAVFESGVLLGNSEHRRDLRMVPAAAVEGVVRRSADGAPVAGAVVSAAGSAEAVSITDERGFFRLERLPAGSLSLQARAHRLTSEVAPVQLGIGETRTALELWLDEGANVAGQVVSARGEPIVGAAVALFEMVSEREFPARDVTDAQGRFVVEGMAAGSYSAIVYKETNPVRFLLNKVTVLDQDIDDLELVLQDSQSLVGRVSPPRRASIQLVHRGGESAMGFWALGGDLSDIVNLVLAQTWSSADDGSFTVEAVGAGSYELVAIADDGTAGSRTVAIGDPAAEDVVVELAPTQFLRGRVADTAGKPASAVQVVVSSADRFPAIERVATADDQGRYEIGGFLPGEYKLVVLDARCQRELVAADGSSVGTWTVEFSKGSGAVDLDVSTTSCARTLAGRVVDASGAPVVDAWVSLHAEDRERAALSDEEGQFQLSGVSEGALELTAYHPKVGSTRLSLAADYQGPATLRLQKGAELRVTAFLDDAPLDKFEVSLLDGPTASRALARDGTSVHRNLAAGTYLVEARSKTAAGRLELDLDWGEDKEVQIHLRRWAKISGVLHTADGKPAAGYAVTPLHTGFTNEARGERIIFSVGGAKTADDGRFAIEQVRSDSVVLMGTSPEGTFCFVPLKLEDGQTLDLGVVACRPKESFKP